MRNLLLVLCFAFISVSGHAMGNLPSTAMGSSLVGHAAPEFTLERLHGDVSNFTTAREGKKAVIIFWATWCPHCHQELDKLKTTIGPLEEQGIKVLLVNVGETKEEVMAYFNKKQHTFNSFIDEENALQAPYHLIGVPTLIFIDEAGIIRNIKHEFPRNFETYFSAPQ